MAEHSLHSTTSTTLELTNFLNIKMKNRPLQTFFAIVLALFASILFTFEAKADTSVISNGKNGWTKITSLPSNLSDYYFVFVDNTKDLMLSYGEGYNESTDLSYKTMVYRTSEDPAMNPAMLWQISTNNADGGTSWSIKSAVEPTFFIQTEWNAAWYCRTHDQNAENVTWCKWIINYVDDLYWTIQNGKYPDEGYIGPWDNTIANGREVAGNKAGDVIGKFQIYAILRSEVGWETNASELNPANYTYKLANSYAAFNGTTGWTGTGTRTRNGGTGFDGVAGFFEFCNWEASSWNGTLSQTISGLPAGKYRVRAAGQLSDTNVTLTLDVNGTSANFPANGTSNGTILASGKETSAGKGVAGWRYVSIDKTILANTDLVITFSSSGNAQYRWANVDNVELYYLGPAVNVYDQLQAALDAYAPYNDIAEAEDVTEYTRNYNTYKTYTEATSQSDMSAAITYMQDNYANYQWANASINHPVDVTVGIISGWECTSNDAWSGSGRTTATGTYFDGTSRTYFTQNHEDGAARSQTVTIPKVGAYLLRTIVRPMADASYATITIGNESTTTRGRQTGTTNIGYNWAYNDVYFSTTAQNASMSISISLSNINNSREADCGEMHLYYIGQSADFVKDGIHKYIGTFATAPAIELTDDVPVTDVSVATFTSGSSTVTFTNPNGLVFVASDGQTSAAKNEVIGTTCASLQLEKGHPFINPKEFTATTAKYTLTSEELAGGSFATLMIPFAASSLAGTAYTLNQGVDRLDGNIHGTVTSSIAANSPVLVKANGNYSGSSVTVPATANGATYTNGELVGTYTPINAPESSYVLQNHTAGEGVAFYLVGSTKPTVNPFRAYIKAQSSNVRALQFQSEGETDGIHFVDNEGTKNVIFNLAGQRISKPQRGVYIVNGKKVIIK